MKFLAIALALTLSACSTTVPVTAKFPAAPGTLVQLETMVATVLPLIPQSWQILSVSSPRIRQANTNDVYSVEVSITTIYNP